MYDEDPLKLLTIKDQVTYMYYTVAIYIIKVVSISMDGWMTCDFTSFLTVFQSYQADVKMIMKGCAM